MTLPDFRLDDRTFDSLRQEAQQRISKLCPTWTDFNPSDPGVTLVELMAWMTETMLYRLNRVPEKNYIKFLELLGVTLESAKPAEAWLVMEPRKNADKSADGKPKAVRIAAGTKVSARGDGGDPIPFETQTSVSLTTAEIGDIGTKSATGKKDHSLRLLGKSPRPVTLFASEVPATHAFYVGGDTWEAIAADTTLKIHIVIDTPGRGVQLVWECWRDDAWEALEVHDGTNEFTESGDVVFPDRPLPEKTEVGGREGYWIRARITDSHEPVLPSFASVERSLELKEGHVLPPTAAYVWSATAPELKDSQVDVPSHAQPVDLAGVVFPFGRRPGKGTAFYLRHWTFGRPGAEIGLHVESTPDHLAVLGSATWEYHATNGTWKPLTIKRPIRGPIEFACPPDVGRYGAFGEPGFFVRAIQTVDGIKEKNAPSIQSLGIRFRDAPRPWQSYAQENYETVRLLRSGASVTPFEIDTKRDPALYLSLNRKPIDTVRMLLRFDEQLTDCSDVVVWEYLRRVGWSRLALADDSTRGLARRGVIEFEPPRDWTNNSEPGASGYWIRARCRTGARPPVKLWGVHLNAVRALQRERRIHKAPLSGAGRPSRKVQLPKAPVLPGAVVWVRELEDATQTKQTELRDELGDAARFEGGKGLRGEYTEAWVRWDVRANLYFSTADDRHYELDPHRGTVTFGDGVHGRQPPDNALVRVDPYYVGGGTRGNVPRSTITVVEATEETKAIERVVNPDRAEGGAEAETIDEAKLRGPWFLKHQERAVTREDYERLAVQASTEVAKATCLPTEGGVRVIIVPDGEDPKPIPSSRLLDIVRRHLDKRRVVTARVDVEWPEYDDIMVDVSVVAEPKHLGSASYKRIREKLEAKLSRLVHPLRGGPDGRGWPIGRTLHLSELYYRLEDDLIEGIDHISRVRMRRRKEKSWSNRRIKFAPNTYPHVWRPRIDVLHPVEA